MDRAPHRLASSGPLAWQPAGPRLAVLSAEGLVLLDPHAPSERVIGPRGALRDLAWSPRGDTIALSSEGQSRLSLVRAADGAILWQVDPGDEPDEVLWSPDGAHLFGLGGPSVLCEASTGNLRWSCRREAWRTHPIIDHLQGREGARFSSETLWPTEARWSPDSRFVAVRWADLLQVLDLQGRVVHEGPAGPTAAGSATRPRGAADRIAWGHRGETLFQEGTLRLGRCSLVTNDVWAGSFTFSPDGRFAAAEGTEHVLHVRDEDGGQSRLAGHPRTLTALAWSLDGTLATSCRDGRLRRVAGWQGPVEPWVDLGTQAEQLAWSSDGRWLAAGTSRETWLIAVA